MHQGTAHLGWISFSVNCGFIGAGNITPVGPQFLQSPSFPSLLLAPTHLGSGHHVILAFHRWKDSGLRTQDVGHKLEDRALYAGSIEPCCVLLTTHEWAQGCSCLVGRWEDLRLTVVSSCRVAGAGREQRWDSVG